MTISLLNLKIHSKGLIESLIIWRLYLLFLRLIPIIPYQVINILFGLTKVSSLTFWWSSQLGMLPIQIIIVNAGVQMSKLNQLNEIFSLKVVISLILLASIPVCLRFANKYQLRN